MYKLLWALRLAGGRQGGDERNSRDEDDSRQALQETTGEDTSRTSSEVLHVARQRDAGKGQCSDSSSLKITGMRGNSELCFISSIMEVSKYRNGRSKNASNRYPILQSYLGIPCRIVNISERSVSQEVRNLPN